MQDKREDIKKKWNRVLPANELLFDRWEKARYLNSGEGSSIYDSSIIMGKVSIGKDVWIGPFTIIEAINGEIVIGDNCNISAGVNIYTHDSALHVVSEGREPFKKGNVYIGNNTYIGSLSVISCNVTIGDNCIIGAKSFVNKNVPDNSVVFGIPAVLKGRVVYDKDKIRIEYL